MGFKSSNNVFFKAKKIWKYEFCSRSKKYTETVKQTEHSWNGNVAATLTVLNRLLFLTAKIETNLRLWHQFPFQLQVVPFRLRTMQIILVPITSFAFPASPIYFGCLCRLHEKCSSGFQSKLFLSTSNNFEALHGIEGLRRKKNLKKETNHVLDLKFEGKV